MTRSLLVLVALAVLALPSRAHAQREERSTSLTYKGVTANAITKPENHTLNRNPRVPGWGGCVPSSVRTAALHAGIPHDQVDHFWEIAQERVGVGGTGPQLLAEMVNAAFPGEKWISVVDSDPETIRRTMDGLSAQGHVLCGTMAWGELYGPRKIAHMVNYDHFSTADGLAAVEDNNDPAGVYRWMTDVEALARVMGQGGQGWIFAFTRLPAAAQFAVLVVLAASLMLLAAALALALVGCIARPICSR